MVKIVLCSNSFHKINKLHGIKIKGYINNINQEAFKFSKNELLFTSLHILDEFFVFTRGRQDK